MPLTRYQKDWLLKDQNIDPNEWDIDDNDQLIQKAKLSPSISSTPLSAQSADIVKYSSDTPLQTFGKSAASSAFPSLAGGGGAAAGIAMGTPLGPLGMVAGGIGGSLLGNYLGRKTQSAILPESVEENVAASQAQNPISGTVGSLATLPLGGLYPSPSMLGKGLGAIPKLVTGLSRTPQETAALVNMGVGAGMGAAMPIGESLVSKGEMPGIGDIGLNALIGAAFTRPNRIGRKLGFPDPMNMPQRHADIRQTNPAEYGESTVSPVLEAKGTAQDIASTMGARRLTPEEEILGSLAKKKAQSPLQSYSGNIGEQPVGTTGAKTEIVTPNEEALARMEAEGGAPYTGLGESQIRNPVSKSASESAMAMEEARNKMAASIKHAFEMERIERNVSMVKQDQMISADIINNIHRYTDIPEEQFNAIVSDRSKGWIEKQQILENISSEYNKLQSNETRPFVLQSKPPLETKPRIGSGLVLESKPPVASPQRTASGLVMESKLPQPSPQRTASKLAIDVPPKYSEEPQLSTSKTKLGETVNQQLKDRGISTSPTAEWTSMFQKEGILHRNAIVSEDGSITNAKTGKSIAGLATFDKALKRWLIKLNPEKQTLETAPHELAHAFLETLRAKGDPLVAKFEKLVSDLPEFKEINKRRVGAGEEPWTPDEMIATEQGLEYLNRQFNLKGETGLKTWWKDLTAHFKATFSNATPEEYRRLLQYRSLNDASYGVNTKDINAVPKNSDDSQLKKNYNGFSYDGTHDWGKGVGKQMQFTLRNAAKGSKEEGATFYLPEGSDERTIVSRANEVLKKFKETPKMSEESQLSRKEYTKEEGEEARKAIGEKLNKEEEAGNIQASKEIDAMDNFKANQDNPQLDTPEFKKWFGNSKVVDENGKPLEMFHGAFRPVFTKFETRGDNGQQLGPGSYFTSNANRSNNFTGDKGAIYKVWLKMENPLIIRSNDHYNSLAQDFLVDNPKDYKRIADKIFSESSKDAQDYYTSKGKYNYINLKDVYSRWLQESGYDGIIEQKFHSGKPIIQDAVVFNPEQIKSATGNKGTFDSSNPDIRYQDEPQLSTTRSPKQSFAPFLTSRIDKINERLPNSPAAKIVTEQFHKFAGESDLMSARIGNRLISASKGYTPEQIAKVYRHNHQVDDKGSSLIKLTPEEQKLSARITEILREPRKEQIELGLKIKQGKDNFRVAGIKPEGYMFNVLDSKVAFEWAERPDSQLSKSYDKMYVDHLVKKGLSEADAKKMLYDYQLALGNNAAQDIEFGALRKAEGYGLPWELVEKNFNAASTRYGKRAGRDLAYFKHIQNDPRMLKALSLKDQFGNKVDPDSLPDIHFIGKNPAVKQALRSVIGIDVPNNPRALAASRLVNNHLMGIGTSVRNILQVPAQIATYVQLKQLPLVYKAIKNLNDSRVRAFENGAVKASFAEYDQAGYYEGNPDPAIKLLNRWSDLARKYQGRNFSDKFEGEFYYSLGEVLATDNIARAKLGDKEAIAYVEKFSDLVEGGSKKLLSKDTPISPDDISRMAKRFVDSSRGSYGPEGLPSWAIEGPYAPFTSLSRWSIEKSNTIWKDVVMPLKKGNYGPLIRYALGSAGVGFLIEEVNELLSGKRGPEPKINEIIASGDEKDLVSKAISLLQLASFGGIVSDGAQLANNLVRNKSIKYNQPLSFPLYSWMTDTVAGNISGMVNALKEGEDPFDTMAHFLTNLATSSVQTARYIGNYADKEGTARKEKYRDYNIWQELTDRKSPSGDTGSTTAASYTNLDAKKFKKETDLKKASEEVGSLIQKAIEKSKDRNGNIDPEQLNAELRKIKQNSYQTFPDYQTNPVAFMQYRQHLIDTLGEQEANERIADYLNTKQVNKIKSSMVPFI